MLSRINIQVISCLGFEEQCWKGHSGTFILVPSQELIARSKVTHDLDLSQHSSRSLCLDSPAFFEIPLKSVFHMAGSLKRF